MGFLVCFPNESLSRRTRHPGADVRRRCAQSAPQKCAEVGTCTDVFITVAVPWPAGGDQVLDGAWAADMIQVCLVITSAMLTKIAAMIGVTNSNASKGSVYCSFAVEDLVVVP